LPHRQKNKSNGIRIHQLERGIHDSPAGICFGSSRGRTEHVHAGWGCGLCLIVGQNAFLLQQATYLTDEVPDLVTAVEYNTIATATANAGDLISAEKYYKKAIEVSPNNYYRSLAIRSYAAYLFPQRRFEEARENFEKAISLLTGGDNLVRYTNGFTYQMWAWNESNNAASSKRAEELFESAINEFNGIDNETVRRDALNGLQAAKGSPSAPKPALQPVAPNVVPAELKR